MRAPCLQAVRPTSVWLAALNQMGDTLTGSPPLHASLTADLLVRNAAGSYGELLQGLSGGQGNPACSSWLCWCGLDRLFSRAAQHRHPQPCARQPAGTPQAAGRQVRGVFELTVLLYLLQWQSIGQPAANTSRCTPRFPLGASTFGCTPVLPIETAKLLT